MFKGLRRRRGLVPCDDRQRPLPNQGRRSARGLALPPEAGPGSLGAIVTRRVTAEYYASPASESPPEIIVRASQTTSGCFAPLAAIRSLMMNPLQFLAGYMDVANTLLLDNALATMGPGSFINWTSCSRPSTQYSGPLSPHTSAEAMVSACAL